MGPGTDMDDFILLGLIGIVFLLLGPIGFFLTLGARSRLKNVEAQLAALLGRAPLEERERSVEPPRDIASAAPLPPSPQPDHESAADGMEQIRLALIGDDARPAP